MPTFEITNPTTKQKLRITGDTFPTEQELEEIFSGTSGEAPIVGKDEPVTFGELPPEKTLKESAEGTAFQALVPEIPESTITPRKGTMGEVVEEDVNISQEPTLVATETAPGMLPNLELKDKPDVNKISTLAVRSLPLGTQFTPKEATEALFGGLSVAGQVLEGPKRYLGALLNREEGLTILQEMSNPDAGLGKQLRQVVRNSDQPGAIKFLEEMGISIVEDPLTYVTGLLSTVNKSVAAGKLTKSGLELSEQAKKAVLRPGLKGKAAEGVDPALFTRAERELVGKGEVPTKIAAKEAKARALVPEIGEELKAARIENVSNKIKEFQQKSGFLEIGAEDLTADVAGDFDKAFKKFRATVEPKYKRINLEADKKFMTEAQNQELSSALKSVIAPDESDLSALSSKLQSGSINADEYNKLFKLTDGKLTSSLSDGDFKDLGISKKVFTEIAENAARAGKGSVTFKNMQHRRNLLGKMRRAAFRDENAGMRDVKVLGEGYDALTRSMENHLRSIGGDDLVKTWKQADEVFSDAAGSYKKLRDEFYVKTEKGKMELKPPETILRSLTNSTNKNAAVNLSKLKTLLSDESFNTLRNAYFNDMIQKASVNGVVDPKKFLQLANKQKTWAWNDIFTKEMADDVADILQDAAADDIAKTLNRVKTGAAKPQAVKSALNRLTGAGYRFMLWTGRIGLLSVTFGAKLLADSIMRKRAIKSASEFLRDVNNDALKSGFTKRVPIKDQARRAATIVGSPVIAPETQLRAVGGQIAREEAQAPPGVNPLTP